MKKKNLTIISGILIFIIIGGILIFTRNNTTEKKIFNNAIEIKTKQQVTVEIMSKPLSPADFFETPINFNDVEIYYYDQDKKIIFIDQYNVIGTYNVVIKTQEIKFETTINIVDTKNPILETKDVTIDEGNQYNASDFVQNCSDNSGKDCILNIANQEKYLTAGTYEITIVAKDESNNETEQKANLVINKKTTTISSNTSIKKPLDNGSTFVETKKETNTETSDFKYGIIKETTTTTTYDLYSDGTKKNSKTTTQNSYNYSTYNATTNDLLPEASTNRNTYASQVNEILTYTNEYRKEVGIEPLQLDETLTKAAMVRAMELSYGNTLSHTRPNGDMCFSVMDEIGYYSLSSGENIAWYQQSPKGATTSWRNSPGHYANMINSDYTKIGIGVMYFNGYYYWVQLFSN